MSTLCYHIMCCIDFVPSGEETPFVLVVGMGYAAVTCSMFTGGGGEVNLKINFFRNEVYSGSFSVKG